ncbi:unnamed protein product, partial [Mesorhabditis spiculigera]
MAGTNCKDCGRFRPKDPTLPFITCTRKAEKIERTRQDDEVVLPSTPLLPLQHQRQDETLKEETETGDMEQSFSSIASLSSDPIRELMKDMLEP